MADDRLMHTSDSELERQILRAAAEEKVPADVRRRALASLGLLAIAPVGAVSTAAASSEGVAAAAKSLGWQASLAKLSAIVGIGGTALGVGTFVMRPPAAPEVPVTEAAAVSRKPRLEPLPAPVEVVTPSQESGCPSEKALADAKARVAEPVATVASARAELPRPAPARAVVPSRVKSGSPEASSARTPGAESRGAPAREQEPPPQIAATSIREEIDLLDRARAQLSRGNSRAAAEIIGQYFARYPNGELRAEAEFVRREARLADH